MDVGAHEGARHALTYVAAAHTRAIATIERCCAMAFVFQPQRARPPHPPAAALANVWPRRRRPDDTGSGLSQVRWVGEREMLLGCCRTAAAKMEPPSLESPPAPASSLTSPSTGANTRLTEPREIGPTVVSW